MQRLVAQRLDEALGESKAEVERLRAELGAVAWRKDEIERLRKVLLAIADGRWNDGREPISASAYALLALSGEEWK